MWTTGGQNPFSVANLGFLKKVYNCNNKMNMLERQQSSEGIFHLVFSGYNVTIGLL